MDLAVPRISVLVVDDNEDHRRLIERRLQDAGVDVRQAADGTEALGRLDGIDLVLLDYRLPGLSGIDTLQRIRLTNGPSVVMVTGMGSESIAVEAMRAGAVDYVVKDADYLAALPQIVERAWRVHDLARRARELQRLALLVNSATERLTIFGEIVSGARHLLRSDACALYVRSAVGVVCEAMAGQVDVNLDDLAGAAASVLSGSAEALVDVLAPAGSGEEHGLSDRLFVPLPSPDGDPIGVLVVLASKPRPFLFEEIELAGVFASFAGTALRNLDQLELERTLVAELQHNLELRRDLVASVSHELRTPLTCITGFSSTLLQHWNVLGEAERRDFVGKVHHHAEELADLVEGLLDFASAEAGKLQADLVATDLPHAIASAIEGLAPLIAGRAVTLEVDAVWVLADEHLLRRTLVNLLANAIKYSDPGSPVVVRSMSEGGLVRVEVVDRGVGLAADEAYRVFEPFWRAHRGDKAKRGTGIGLTLVRDYVRLMGGQVRVQSQLGEGSTFSFTLRRPS
jgi:signal transduction histidine kinase/CheY-like chemotaxis protein